MYDYPIKLQELIMPVCKKCEEKFPNRIKVDGKDRNLQSRKYCLTCSPFGNHNTKKLDLKPKSHKDKRRCPRCEKEKTIGDFYKRRKGNDPSPYCKKCSNEQTIERQRAFKKKCIDYKGGKCELCDYNKCIGALEFHHKDPNLKEFGLAGAELKGSIKGELKEEIKKELDKCSLFCANCHREEHERLSEYPQQGSNLQPTA